MNNFISYTPYNEANIFLNAAKENGWDITFLVTKGNELAELKKGTLTYRFIASGSRISVNNSVSTGISSNKLLTHDTLESHTPYIADTQAFIIDELTDEVLQNFLNKHQKVVVKPLSENNGVGITTNIKDLADLKKAVAKVKELKQRRVLIENHVETTSEYRVIVWKGEVIDIIQRIPAFITGDGQSTIEKLITEKNQRRAELLAEPIIIDDDLLRNLSKLNMDQNSVPALDQHVQVRVMCNMTQGGETKRIDVATVHPEFKEMFSKIYDATWLNYYGADLITPDVTQAPELGKTIINELNGSPGFPANYYADLAEGRQFYGAAQILNKMETDPVQWK